MLFWAERWSTYPSSAYLTILSGQMKAIYCKQVTWVLWRKMLVRTVIIYSGMVLVDPMSGAAQAQIRTCSDLSHFPRSVPRNHSVAFVQMLVLAARCLHVDVPYGHGHVGAQVPACGQEPPWQAAALHASALLLLSSPLLPERLHSVSKDRNWDSRKDPDQNRREDGADFHFW